MQKKSKTALRARSRRKVSSAPQPSGLIASGKNARQSAGTKSALDNRSHRTALIPLTGAVRREASADHRSFSLLCEMPRKAPPVEASRGINQRGIAFLVEGSSTAEEQVSGFRVVSVVSVPSVLPHRTTKEHRRASIAGAPMCSVFTDSYQLLTDSCRYGPGLMSVACRSITTRPPLVNPKSLRIVPGGSPGNGRLARSGP